MSDDGCPQQTIDQYPWESFAMKATTTSTITMTSTVTTEATYKLVGTGYCTDSSGALPYLFYKNGGSQTQCQANCSAYDWCQAFHFTTSSSANCAIFVDAAYSDSTPSVPSGYSTTSGDFTSVSQTNGASGYSCYKKQQAALPGNTFWK
jgi:hypothetical protein